MARATASMSYCRARTKPSSSTAEEGAPLPSLIRDRAASTAEMIAAFDDAALVAAALAFEAALARAQAAGGLITAEAAAAIEAAIADYRPSIPELAEAAAHAGALAIPLVAALRERLKDRPEAARAVHLGA